MTKRNSDNLPTTSLTLGLAPEIIAKLSLRDPVAVQILMFFIENMDDHNMLHASQTNIIDTLHVSAKAGPDAIRFLVQENIISVGTIKNVSVYTVNPEVALYDLDDTRKQLRGIKTRLDTMFGVKESRQTFKDFTKIYDTYSDNTLTIDKITAKKNKERLNSFL